MERRGGYYERAGALRDMIPNHLLQLLSLTTMEPPISFQADVVRDEQSKVLHAIQPMLPEDVLTRAVRGQYAEGAIAGQHVPGYRERGVCRPPFERGNLRGIEAPVGQLALGGRSVLHKDRVRLARRATEIVTQFRRAPLVLFRDTPVEKLTPNLLVIHIQPDEGISLSFGAKIPGAHVRVGDVKMNFRYADYFGAEPSTGYERLLVRLHDRRRKRCSSVRIYGSLLERGRAGAGCLESLCPRARFQTMPPAAGVRKKPMI